MNNLFRRILPGILGYFTLLSPVFAQPAIQELKFDFGDGALKDSFIRVTEDMPYDPARGYGFISLSPMKSISRDQTDPLLSDFCTSDKPFSFVADLPAGDYEIRLTFGDLLDSTCTTVKAESRRLMLQAVRTKPGEFITRTIMVNVRVPVTCTGDSIRLKSREYSYLNWDGKLNLEFNNSRPCINALEIIPARPAVTVFLAGNSTVVDQNKEPWCSWGQMITNFLSKDVIVTNLAESGDALKSFKSENRLKKLICMVDSGDYVFIEFGHNDQKKESSAYVEAFTGYKEELKDYISRIRAKGANPVLVSPTQRRVFDEEGKIVNTHGDYPEAMRQTATEESVPFIDLNTMSKILFETLGVEGSKRAFVHYPANSFPGENKALADNTHFNNYGAYELAKCILQGIIDLDLDLKKYIVNFESFNPALPDNVDSFAIPESSFFEAQKPDGN